MEEECKGKGHGVEIEGMLRETRKELEVAAR